MDVVASHRMAGIAFGLLGAAILLGLPAPSSAAPKLRPNLALSKLVDPPSTASPGQTLSIGLRTRNTGKRTAKATQNAFFLSGDKQRSANDVKLEGAQRVSKLKSGKGKSGPATARIPTSAAAGGYFLIACADSQGKVKERSEKDNCVASKGAITIAVALSTAPGPTDPVQLPTRRPRRGSCCHKTTSTWSRVFRTRQLQRDSSFNRPPTPS